MRVDSEKTTAHDVVQINNINVVVKDVGKRPMDFGNSVDSSVQKPVMGNDHETSISNTTSKYFQPRWCPSGLTHTQKRKLQRLRFQEKREQESKKLRGEQFNQYRPLVPQGKVWRVKAAGQPARSVKPPQTTGLTGVDWSDRLELPVRPVEPSIQQKAKSAVPVSVYCDEETPLAPSVQDDEELVDYEATPRMQQYGAQRDFSAWGAKYWRMIIYLIKLLFSRSVCKGRSKF